MYIWLVTVGEPLPTDGTNERLHRAGMLANYLVEHGHQVTWWTSTYNHAQKKQRFDKDTFIKVSEGYHINLLHSPPYKRNVSIQRLVNHRDIARKFSKMVETEKKPDIILCSLPTLELSLASSQYGKRIGIPVVLDVRDLWPDLFLDLVPPWGQWMAKIILYPYYKKAKVACSMATAIAGTTPPYVEWGVKNAGRFKTEKDRNFPFTYLQSLLEDEEILRANKKWRSYGIGINNDEFICCFFGTIGRQFELDTVINAAKKLQLGKRTIKFVLCGSGDKLEYYRQLAKGANNIIFPGWINSTEIWALMKMSKIGLAPYRNVKNFTMNLPNKPVEYMSAGLPVVSSLSGYLNELLTAHRCGITYKSGDVEDLINHLNHLYDHPEQVLEMSKKAYKLYVDNFTTDKVFGSMEKYLNLIALNNS